MGYLDLSEQGNKPALNNLCHLIQLLDRHYQHKVQRLDKELLKRILYHLIDCELNSEHSTKVANTKNRRLLSQLTHCELSTPELCEDAFIICTNYAKKILMENQAITSTTKDEFTPSILKADYFSSEQDTEINQTIE